MGVLVIAGMLVSFWLGTRYQNAVASWADHQAQRTKELKARRARWAAWQATVWPACAVAVVLIVAAVAAGRD